MKNKWSKLLLVAPVVSTAVLPITFLTGCSSEDKNVSHIQISDVGKTMVKVIIAKKKKDLLAPETFPHTLNAYYNRSATYMQESTAEEIQSTRDDIHFGADVERFKLYEPWSDDHATYTVSPTDTQYDRVVFFLHGGAYARNLQYTHIKTSLLLSNKLHAKFYIPLHPVAPQHDVTECYNFLIHAYQDMVAKEPNKEIIFMGDSSGGALALAFTQLLYETRQKLPAARVLFSPWVDATMTNKEIDKYLERDIMLHPYGLQYYGRLWSNDGCPVTDYKISPINGEMEDGIKTLTFVGSEEIFYPDIRLFHKKLLNHGCDSRLVVADGLFHDWEVFNDLPAAQLGWKELPEVAQAFDMIKDFLDEQPQPTK